MAETYLKSKIEKLIQNLEIKKKVTEESIQFFENYPYDMIAKSILHERVFKLELINELLTDIRKDFDLS